MDSRVQIAVSGPRSQACGPLVEEFLTRYRIEDCSADQLLTLADLAGRCDNTDVAAGALRRVIATGARLHLAHYRLGRLLLAQGLHDQAALHFDQGSAANPAFAFNAMGAARARLGLGLRPEAAAAAERFAAFGVRPHGAEDLAALGELADFLFDAGERDRALPIYAVIHQFGGERPRHVVRLAEARLAAGDEPGARAMLLDQVARTGPDPWSSRALAICHSVAGEHADAIAKAREAVRADPRNAGFVGSLVRVVGKSDDAAAIRGALADHGDILSAQDVVELTVRLHLAQADFDAAAAAILAAPMLPDSRTYHVALETAYAALTAGRNELAAHLADELQRISPDDVTGKALRIDMLFRELRWEEAGEILAGIPADPAERAQITMKRLEYACFAADPAAAMGAVARLEAMQAGKTFLLPVFRYLAEQQDWHGVVDRALPWLDASLNYTQVGYVLFRAAVHTGRHADMLAAILAVEGWAGHAGLRSLRNDLEYDQVRTAAQADRLLGDPLIAGDALLVERLGIQRDVLARADLALDREAVFLCSDRNYLCATIVALHGLAQSARALPGHGAQVDFFIVCDDDVVELATRAVAAFVASGVSVGVVAASTIVPAAERLSAAYGLFTSGHRLSSAAYYRIFFAAHLQQLGRHAHALYVDGDVLLTGRLADLLRLHGSGPPILARLETPRPDVRRAIAHHGLADGQYFNSGVLLIDLRHPDIAAALAASIAAIGDATVTLLYHDQCALNLGFRGQFGGLDMAWNHPVLESTRVDDIPADTGLWHFLNRPKPWSAAYHGEAGPVWFRKWREAAEFLGAEIAAALFLDMRE